VKEYAAAPIHNVVKLKAAVERDRDRLAAMSKRAASVRAEEDPKLAALVVELARIARDAEKEGIDAADQRRKRKVLVFSYFEDTIDYVEKYLRGLVETEKGLACYRGRIASVAGHESRYGVGRDAAVHGFAPQSSGGSPTNSGDDPDRFDLLIATDVLAEGMNLQDCRNAPSSSSDT
jgi:hypothetical protein